MASSQGTPSPPGPPASISDQIRRLSQRGLSIPDTHEAARFLNNVNLYRFQGYLNQYQSGMCISRALKTTERTLILQPQISSRSPLDRRRYLTIPVLGLLQLAPQPQTNETFGE